MKQNVLVTSLVLILIASACAPQGTPTANAADVQNTAIAAAATMVAETLAAVPTATPLPPTETASPIPLPTDTPFPLPTQEGAATLAGGLPTNMPTFTPQAVSNSGTNQDPCNQALTSWQGPTAYFTVANQTKPKGTIVLGIYVVTEMGQCGNLVITGDSFTGPAGQYSAAAFINGKKNMKAFGSFRITGEGKWKIVVKNDTITAAGGCYPNC